MTRRPGATGVYEITLRDDDGGARAFTLRFVDGRLDAVKLGLDPEGDVHIEVPESAYIAYCQGDAGPMNRATLNGEMRMVGDFDTAQALGPVLGSAEFTAVLARVHQRTRYK